MADIEFKVGAVLGDTSKLEQQLQNLKTNLNLKIDNRQALQSVKAVQQQINALQKSMNKLNLNVNGNGGRQGNNRQGGGKSNAVTATVEPKTLKATEALYKQISNSVSGTVKQIQVLRNEQGQITSGTVTVSNGITTWKRNLEFVNGQYQRVIASGRDMVSLTQQQNALNKLGMDTGNTLNTKSIKDVESLKSTLSTTNIGWDNNTHSIKQFSQQVDSAGNTITKFTTRHKAVENGVEVWRDTSYAVSSADGKLRQYNQTQQQVLNTQQSLTTMLSSAIERFAVWGIAKKLWTSIGNAISDCTNYIIDLDSAMTNIRVVTMDTKEATQELLETYNQLGQELGANTLDVAEGAVDWLRQGYEGAEATELVKSSVMLSKLALIDNAQATEYLTSALKGYKMEASQAVSVIDQLVSIDLEAATSAGDMAEAMSRTANMANTTGFKMNELLGMIATMSEVTQNSASTIGNSVKTILSRMSNVKAGLDDFEGEALNDVEKTLNRVGIALRDNQGNWYDFYDVLDEVASRWGEFDDIQQSQITTALGGTRQRENVLVALENWDLVQKYAETGANSAGTAMEKYDIVLESVSAKQEQFNAKIQEFYMNLVSSGLLTGVLDLANGFMDIVNAGDSLVGKLMLVTATSIGLSIALKALKATKLGGTISAWISMLMSMSTAEDITAMKAITLKGALDLLKAHPVIFALAILTTVVTACVVAFDAFTVSLEEQHEKAQELQSEYQSLTSELETLNSELATTQERIDELNKKDKLSVVEKEELELLQKTNAELAKKQYWLEIDKKNKQAEVTKEASKAWEKDFNEQGEYKSRYKTKEISYDARGYKGTSVQAEFITENEYIKEQIQYYGELEEQINKLVAKEGEWTQEEKDRYNSLQTEQKEVQDYLKETGAKIQTDYLDAYDVDDATKNSWTELRDEIGKVVDTAYDATDAVDDIGNEGNIKSVDDAISDYANNLQSLTDKYEILRNAQEEYNKYGNLSAETMQSIINNGLLDYLDVSGGKLTFNTKKLQDNANALQTNAIASLNSALYTDLLAIANGTFNRVSAQTNTSAFTSAVDQMANHCGTARGEVLSLTGAVVAFNNSTGNKLSADNADVQAVFNKYTESIKKVQSLSKNLRLNYNNGRNGAGGGGKGGSKSSKQWWETALESLKDDLDYNVITMDTYISGVQKILNKLKKGSDAWKEVNKELQKAKLDKVENQFKRGEITVDQYIKKLEALRKNYKKNTEGYKELTDTINDAKYDKYASQYERGEITADQYIKKLQSLQKLYKKGSEEYKKIADDIDEIKLEKTEKYLDKLKDKVDAIDQKIDEMGDVNTDEENVKYAELLSQKYSQVQENISSIKKQLADSSITQEQRDALQEELNDLLVEEIDIRDEIEDQVRDYYENQKEQAEQQAELNRKELLYKKEVELYGEKGKELYEYYANKRIEALEAEKEAKDEVNEREQLQNDLLEARLQLQNALNNKTTKILKRQADGTWQYEYSVNMSDVKNAEQAVKDAQKAVEDYELQFNIDAIQKDLDDKNSQYEDAEFWADRDYENIINGIEKTYGDIDALVEQWMNTYGGDSTKLIEGYQAVVSSNNALENALVQLTIAIESRYETVGVGTVGILDGVKHQRIPDIVNAFLNRPNIRNADVTKFNSMMGEKGSVVSGSSTSQNSTVISKVECVFPNINSTDGLQKAILDLPRLALQNK